MVASPSLHVASECPHTLRHTLCEYHSFSEKDVFFSSFLFLCCMARYLCEVEGITIMS